MMENAEEVFQALEEFSKKKHKIIPRELDEYLHFVARTGDPVYQWALVKQLFKEKLLNVITEFYESSSGIEIPHCRNVEVFNYETMKNSLLEKIDAFAAAPFTIQRICELLTSPRKQYSRIDKFMRAFEKNILVVSTRDPGPPRHSDSETDNGDAQESLVNGSDNNSDYNVDVDMEDMSNWKDNSDPLTYAVDSTERGETVRGEEYAAHNGPLHREMMSVGSLEAGREDGDDEEEGRERGPQPSTSSEEEEKMDDDEEEEECTTADRAGEEEREQRIVEEEREEVDKGSAASGEEEDVDVDRVTEEEGDGEGETERKSPTVVTITEVRGEEEEEEAGRERGEEEMMKITESVEVEVQKEELEEEEQQQENITAGEEEMKREDSENAMESEGGEVTQQEEQQEVEASEKVDEDIAAVRSNTVMESNTVEVQQEKEEIQPAEEQEVAMAEVEEQQPQNAEERVTGEQELHESETTPITITTPSPELESDVIAPEIIDNTNSEQNITDTVQPDTQQQTLEQPAVEEQQVAKEEDQVHLAPAIVSEETGEVEVPKEIITNTTTPTSTSNISSQSEEETS